MHVVHKHQTNAFVLISSSESATYDSRETLGGKGKVARPTLFAWLRIAPVVISQMPEVLGGVDASWNELHPTVSQKVESASVKKTGLLSLRWPSVPKHIAGRYGFYSKSTGGSCIAFAARCVPMAALPPSLCDNIGLCVPIAQDQLALIHRRIVQRQRAMARGRSFTFTLSNRISVKDTRIALDFTIPFELCEFALAAMKHFGDELVKLRRARLKKSNEMVFR